VHLKFHALKLVVFKNRDVTGGQGKVAHPQPGQFAGRGTGHVKLLQAGHGQEFSGNVVLMSFSSTTMKCMHIQLAALQQPVLDEQSGQVAVPARRGVPDRKEHERQVQSGRRAQVQGLCCCQSPVV